MTKERFFDEVTDIVLGAYGVGTFAGVSRTPGDNNTPTNWFNIKIPDSVNAASINADKLFDALNEGVMTFEEITEHVMTVIESTKNYKSTSLETDNIVGILINTERNTEYLTTHPHREVADLSIVYGIKKHLPDGRGGTIRITNDQMELAGLTEEDLYQHMMKSFNGVNKPQVKDLATVLSETTGMPREFFDFSDCPMYYISNDTRMNGAIQMLNTDALDHVADIIGTKEITILPSSKDEVLVIPKAVPMGAEELLETVTAINSTTVAPDLFLSNAVYSYSAKTKELKKTAGEDGKEQIIFPALYPAIDLEEPVVRYFTKSNTDFAEIMEEPVSNYETIEELARHTGLDFEGTSLEDFAEQKIVTVNHLDSSGNTYSRECGIYKDYTAFKEAYGLPNSWEYVGDDPASFKGEFLTAEKPQTIAFSSNPSANDAIATGEGKDVKSSLLDAEPPHKDESISAPEQTEKPVKRHKGR